MTQSAKAESGEGEIDRLADEAGSEICRHMEALSLIFVAGAMLTLVVRHPGAPGEMDAVFTTESDLRYPEHVLHARRSMKRGPMGGKWQ